MLIPRWLIARLLVLWLRSLILCLRLLILCLRLLILCLRLVSPSLRRILGLIPLWCALRRYLLRLWLWLRLRLRIRILPTGKHHLASHLRGFDYIWSRLGLRRLERRPWLLNRLRPDLELRLRLRLNRLRLNRLRLGLNRWIGGGGYRLRLSAGGTKPSIVGELGSTIETVFHSL